MQTVEIDRIMNRVRPKGYKITKKMDEFNKKFEKDDDSGAFVMASDAMPKRFDNSFNKQAVEIKILNNDVIEDTKYGKRELAQDNRMLVQAHTLIRLGFKPPKKSLCVVYPDAIERWVASRIKMMRGVLCSKIDATEL